MFIKLTTELLNYVVGYAQSHNGFIFKKLVQKIDRSYS